MGRRSIAQKIIDGIDENIQSDFLNIVVYDFREKEATYRFWANLKEIIGARAHTVFTMARYKEP